MTESLKMKEKKKPTYTLPNQGCILACILLGLSQRIMISQEAEGRDHSGVTFLWVEGP